MSETTAAVAEASVATLGSKATVTGGAASAAGFFMGIDWIGWVGICVAVLGLILQAIFSYRRDKREKLALQKEEQRADEIHQLTVRKLNEECNVKE